MPEELDLKHPKPNRREVTPQSVGATPKRTEESLKHVPPAIEGILRTNTARVRAIEELNDPNSPSGRKPEPLANITNTQSDLFGGVEQQTALDHADTTAKEPTDNEQASTDNKNPQLNLDLGDEK